MGFVASHISQLIFYFIVLCLSVALKMSTTPRPIQTVSNAELYNRWAKVRLPPPSVHHISQLG